MRQITYIKVKVRTSGTVQFDGSEGNYSITKVKPFVEESNGKLHSFNLSAYKVREEQFCNGTASRQKEILDMMISAGVTNGLKGFAGLRYLVDGFKSYVEASYKYQFGQLALSLDNANTFVRCILNEPFQEDLEKSTNPLFKQMPGMPFDWSYVPEGGNKNYSTNFLTKFTTGDYMCFFFGTGLTKDDKIIGVPAGLVSNAFYNKTLAFDVVANTTGYLDNIDGVENPTPDDITRGFMENFNMNPIINFNGGFTIFQNLTGQRSKTSLQQITNSELLAYIKENLYRMSKTEYFKKATYNNYLTTETEVTDFMEGLVLAGAIQANPIVQCNLSNNTTEIQKQKIKLCHVEYMAVDTLDKVVFDLTLN